MKHRFIRICKATFFAQLLFPFQVFSEANGAIESLQNRFAVINLYLYDGIPGDEKPGISGGEGIKVTEKSSLDDASGGENVVCQKIVSTRSPEGESSPRFTCTLKVNFYGDGRVVRGDDDDTAISFHKDPAKFVFRSLKVQSSKSSNVTCKPLDREYASEQCIDLKNELTCNHVPESRFVPKGRTDCYLSFARN